MYSKYYNRFGWWQTCKFVSMIEITASDDLASVKELVLKIVCNEFPIYQLSWYLPVLQKLVLDGSNIKSLRELGCDFHRLEKLYIRNCSLTSLDGILSFKNIKVIDASCNYIKHISYIGFLKRLTHLNLTKNEVRDLKIMAFLKNCITLRVLYLSQNPCSSFIDYRMQLITLLPQIELLDGIPVSDFQFPPQLSENYQNEIGFRNISLMTTGEVISGNLATYIARKVKQQKKKDDKLCDNMFTFLSENYDSSIPTSNISTHILNAATKWKEEFNKCIKK